MRRLLPACKLQDECRLLGVAPAHLRWRIIAITTTTLTLECRIAHRAACIDVNQITYERAWHPDLVVVKDPRCLRVDPRAMPLHYSGEKITGWFHDHHEIVQWTVLQEVWP